MANLSRDWLGPFIEAEFSKALSWKKAQRVEKTDVPIKLEPDADEDDDSFDDGLYWDNGSSLQISVSRPTKGETSYVEIARVRFNSFPVLAHSLIFRLVQNS